MLVQIERLTVAFCFDLKVFQIDLGDLHTSGDEERLRTEEKKKLVQKLEQQRVDVVGIHFDRLFGLLLDGAQIGHVAEHAERTILERLLFGERKKKVELIWLFPIEFEIKRIIFSKIAFAYFSILAPCVNLNVGRVIQVFVLENRKIG